LAVTLWPLLARASDAAVAAPTVSDGVSVGLAHAVGQLTREIVGSLDGTTVVGASDVRLADLQLARGCVGETPECLRPVAEDLGADLLVLPSIDRAAGELVLTLVAFRVSSDAIARAVRRGDEESLMDGLEAQVHEVLGLPPPEESEHAVDETSEAENEALVVEPSDDQSASFGDAGPLPWIIAGVGLVAIGIGVGLGAASSGLQSEYEEAAVVTHHDADPARDAYERGATFATTANVLFAVGGALAIAGAVWLIVAATNTDTPVQVAPVATADGAFIIAVGAL
jgi:hypothetical protein